MGNIYHSVEVFNLGTDYWMKVYNDLSKENVLSYGDLDFIKSIATRIISKNVLPSASQCKRLLKIVHNVEDKGYTKLFLFLQRPLERQQSVPAA